MKRDRDETAAERQRRYRENRRRGAMSVTLVVGRPTRDVLVEARWVREWDEDDREAVQRALQMLVDNLCPVTRDGSG